jgi:predicted ArsR family transcriptional regulator
MEATRDTQVHAALASPTRQRVLDVLRTADDAPTAQQLGATLGLHVTTVRFHLEQLEAAGLVGRHTRRGAGRGRPGVHFRIVGAGLADADTGGAQPDTANLDEARDEMIGALADALAQPTDETRTDAARAAGRRCAERLPEPTETGEALETVAQVFTRLGFGPERDGTSLLLRACPFRAAARSHPQVVCQVHLGLAEGLTARLPGGRDTDVRLRPFVEPDLCELHLAPLAPRGTDGGPSIKSE